MEFIDKIYIEFKIKFKLVYILYIYCLLGHTSDIKISFLSKHPIPYVYADRIWRCFTAPQTKSSHTDDGITIVKFENTECSKMQQHIQMISDF